MAKVANYGDPYTHRLTLRLSDAQMQFLIDVSKLLGVSPSEYVRMTINMAQVSLNQDVSQMSSGKLASLRKVGCTSNENVKTDFNNQL